MVRRVVTPSEILAMVLYGLSQKEYQETKTMMRVGMYVLRRKWPIRRLKVNEIFRQVNS